MTPPALSMLTIAAALGSGLMSGFFFAFSVPVMRALGRVAPAAGIATMQAINVVVLNPWFFAAFFGTAGLCVALAINAIVWWSAPGSAWLLAGSTLYLVGVIGVTIARNVPLNQELAAVAPETPAARKVWGRYLSIWTAWNHVRTAAPLLAAAAFIIALP